MASDVVGCTCSAGPWNCKKCEKAWIEKMAALEEEAGGFSFSGGAKIYRIKPTNMMTVRLVDKNGKTHIGEATFSKGRGKKSVAIFFVGEDGKRREEEFYLLEDFNYAIMVWGQGIDFPDYSYKLHPEDAKKIISSGGG